MWNKQQTQSEAPATQPIPVSPAAPPPASVAAFSASSSLRPGISSDTHASTRLGPGIHITGQIDCSEDLQIDGKFDGPISLKGHTLTVGATATLASEVTAAGIIVYGRIVGNLVATERVDIKTDGSVVGDISTSRISIEDGAHFKGRIEIDPAKFQASRR